MNQLFNIILIIIILIVVYKCIQCTKEPKPEIKEFKPNIIEPKPEIIEYTNTKSNLPIIENFVDLDTKYINFDYETRPIEKEFIKEQKDGAYLYTWYPNTWIEKIDENGNPIYNNRENVTGEKDTFIDGPKSSSSYEFNNVKTVNMSGILKSEDSQGKTIKEIYDNSTVDYKKLGPQKNRITDETSDIVMQGGSNLEYFTADTWTYENENQENGGVIFDNVYGNDPMSNTVSVF
jgi:hypothetical protein